MEGKLVFAAAQQPFLANGNFFCTMVPVWHMDGVEFDLQRDFPTRGLCWFLLRDPGFQSLKPGQLVVGLVQRSEEYGSLRADKDWWLVKVEGAQLAGSSDSVIEVIEAGRDLGDDPRVLLEPEAKLTMDHCPSTLVLVSLGEWIYGPFRTRVPRTGPDEYFRWKVALERTSRPQVNKIHRSRVEEAGFIIRPPKVAISLEAQPPDKASQIMAIAYSFMTWHSFERLRAIGASEVEIRTDAEVLVRAATDHLRPRAKRQQLKLLLDELGASLRSAQDTQTILEPTTLLARLEANIRVSDRIADDLAQTLLHSGVIEDRIDALKEERFTAYVSRRAAEAEALIAEQVQSKSAELASVERRIDEYKGLIEAECAVERAKFEEEINVRRASADSELKAERETIKGEIEALKREQETLVATLEHAADRFTKGRSQLLTDLVALLPALAAAGVTSAPPVQAGGLPIVPAQPTHSAPALPSPFVAQHSSPGNRLPEEAFFDRFVRHVEASGFHYRNHDLKAFHISVKCSDLTVLAGLSGIGKSSLVTLYAEALAGDDQTAQSRLLTVDVSPSWTEPQDLLGSVNLLDRRFEPAANGLFNHLVAAAQEHRKVGSHAGMVVVALDEMNLAQVEHYFAGFIQGLERDHSRREMAVFDPSALRPDDPLRDFARVPLSPTLRFVGTVNFDETTRPLSQRLKDRAAVLELIGERHSGLQYGALPRPVPAGPPVLLADMQSWLERDKAIPVDIATFLDKLNGAVLRLGCPITNRRVAAINRLLASSASIMPVEQALDIAVASRVLPMLRHFSSLAALEEASRLHELLSSAPGGCTDSVRMINLLREQAVSDLANGLEDA